MKLAEVFAHWERVRKGTFETIDKFEQDELDFAPYAGAWSVRQICVHIANAEDGWFRHTVTGEAAEWPAEADPEDYPDVSALKSLLTDVHQRTIDYLEDPKLDEFDRPVELSWGPTVPLNWIFWHVLEHEIHHRGELSLILGILGKEGLDV